LAVAFAIFGAGLSAADDMMEIELTLPDPYFGGTPLDYFGPNLEKPNYKPREPFMAPAGTTNAAQGKPVDSSASAAEFGEMEFLVDGDKDYRKKALLGLPTGHQWVQVDLGAAHDIYGILLWHFHEGERVYFDVAVQVADDADFGGGVKTVFNNDHDNTAGLGAGEDKEYIEGYKGKLIRLEEPVRGRYVRFYSKGNTTDDMNHYVEAEVYGKAAE
jgi:hypothetical protein